MIGISGVLTIPIGQEITQIHPQYAGVGEVGDWKQKLVNRKPGWNEVLERVQKYPGAQKQKID